MARKRSQSEDRPLPRNLDAERSVLGAIIAKNSVLPCVGEQLSSADFFSSQHRPIYECILNLHKRNSGIDLVTVVEELRRVGTLEIAGGPAYVASLADDIPILNVAEYCKIVKNKSTLRAILHALHESEERVYAEEEDSAAILGRARLAFAQLDDQQDAADIFDTWQEFQNAKPLRALIENALWADVANVVGGLSGEGKTLILLSTTKALLSGKPLFGHFHVLEPLDRCVYLIPECSRTPFFHRAKLFGLDEQLENGRLLVRTLTKGPRVDLDDPRLLRHVRDAAVMIDTAARFGEGDENSASEVANGLASDIFGLLSAGAACVPIAHHSPKSFAKDNYISLENVLRGSGDFGAFVGAGFGIRQIDKIQNVIHVETIKARDSEPAEPFQLIGRPWIDQEGDFRVHRPPGSCGKLAEYLDNLPGRNKGGATEESRDSKAANLASMRRWLSEDPKLTSPELVDKFRAEGIPLRDSTVRHYRAELEKSRKTTGG